MPATTLDRLIEWAAPGWGARRLADRMAMQATRDVQALYRGAAQTRLDSGWTTTLGYSGRNHPLNRFRLTKMRDRARDLERNNPLARGLLDRVVENVVGTGFLVQARTPDKDFNERAEAVFSEWFAQADIRGLFTGPLLQQIVFRSMLRDGDVGVALVDRGRDSPVPKLQIIEGDLIDTPFGEQDNPDLIDGIEFDRFGRPLKYHLVNVTPRGTREELGVVPARDFIYLGRFQRAAQVRGEPCLAPVFDLFDQVDGYKEAVVVAARVGASQAMLIKKTSSALDLGRRPTQIGPDLQNQKIHKIEPGSVHYLQPDEDVVGFNPTQPQSQFSDFIRTLVRICGVVVGMPLEILMLDFSQSNYSNARAALLQLQRACRPVQQYMIDRFFSVVYRWRLSKAVQAGELIVPDALLGSYWDHQWIAPGWAWVDPVKDLQAAMLAVDSNLDSLSAIAMSHGRELKDVLAARKRELDMIHELKLPETRSNQTRDVGAAPGGGTPGGPPGQPPGQDGGDGPDNPDARPAPSPPRAVPGKTPAGKTTAGPRAEVERASDGRFGTTAGEHVGPKRKPATPKGPEQEPRPSAKAQLAKQSATYVGKDIQRYAEEHNEPQFASSIGGLSYKDNEPVDVVAGKGGVVEHGCELKTMVANKASKLTMDRYAQVRKVEWEREKKATFHTVVIDDRAVYNAKGEGEHDESKRVYYYRRGIAGSARIESMQKCGSVGEVRKLMAADEKTLPPAAQRTDAGVRAGRWKPIVDKQGKGFVNSKSGEIVRPKK